MTEQKPNHSRYTINLRLLLVTLLIIAIAGPAIYFWHLRSLTKISSVFLIDAQELIDQADQQKQAGEGVEADESLRQAVDLIWQYRNIHPEDGPAMVLLAKTYDRAPQGKSNRKRSAQLYLEALIRSDGTESNELRLRAGEIYLEMGDFAAAEDIARKMKSDADANGQDTKLQAAVSRILVLAQYGQLIRQNWTGGPEGVLGPEVEQAMTENPYDTDLPLLWATTYRNPAGHKYLSDSQRQQLEQDDVSVTEMAAQTADQIVDQMVQRNLQRTQSAEPAAAETGAAGVKTADEIPTSTPTLTPTQNLARAYLRRFVYRKEYGIDGAEDDLRLARQNDPDDWNIALQQGLYLWQQFQQEQVANSSPETLTEDQRTRLNQAATYFESCLEKNPGMLTAQLNLGDVQLALGDTSRALDNWKSTLVQADENSDIPMLATCYGRLIGALIDLGRTEEAREQLDAMDSAIQRYSLRTGDPRLLSELSQSQQLLTGALQFNNRSYAAAISTLEKALATQTARGSRQTFGMIRLLGRIYTQLGQPSRAANTYRSAIAIDGTNREFRSLLSRALSQAGQYSLATDAFKPLVRDDNASAEDWLEYAKLLYRQEANKPAQLRRWQPLDNALRQTQELAQQLSDDQRWQLQSLQIQAQLSWSTSDPAASDQAASDNNPGNGLSMKELMENFEAQAGDNAERMRDLVLIYSQTDQPEKAQQWLEKYKTVADQGAERYIFEAELLVKGKQMDAAAAKLEEGLARVDEDQRRQLQLAQVSLMLNRGEFDQALAKLEAVADQYPDAPELVFQLAELVIQMPNQIKPEPAAWEQRLLELEGGNGPCTNYLKAQRALFAYRDTTDPSQRDLSLKVASNLCFAILRVRPNWPTAYSLAGLVDQVRSEWLIEKNRTNPGAGNRQQVLQQAQELRDSARGYLRQAVDLGERRSAVLLRLAELDPSARGQLLSLLDPQRISGDRRLSNMQMSMQVANNDLDNAQRIAIEATDARPSDPYAWLDRARIEVMRQSAAAAEKSIARARELITASAEPLPLLGGLFSVSLLGQQFSTTAEDKEKWNAQARELIPEILKLTAAEDRLFENARLLSDVGDDQAGDFFLQAEKQNPDKIEVLRAALDYFASRNVSDNTAFDQAIRIGNRLLELNPVETGYRRLLANMLASRGSVDDWNQINQLLDEQQLSALSSDATNQRALAALLLSNRDLPNSQRLENLARAEAAIKDGQTAADLALRGQIFREWAGLLDAAKNSQLRVSKLDSAATNLAQAAEAPDVNSVQLFRIIDFFIQQPQWKTTQPEWETPALRLDIANSYLRKMKSLVGDSVLDLGPAVALEARLMHRQAQLTGTDNSAAIVRMVEDYGQQIQKIGSLSKPLRARYCQQVAQILKSVDAAPEAVLKWQQLAIQEDQSQRLVLATRLAENGDLDQALDECLIGYNESKLPNYAIAMTSFLLTGDTQPQHLEKAEPVFESALRDFPTNVVLLDSIASVRFACQNKVQDAIALYERALKIDGNKPLLMNNLATAYAELPDQLSKALQVVELAIGKHGLRPFLVDTRATIWMRQGKLDQAETELRNIINQQADPRFWCHLAEVKWKQYEKSGAAADVEQARSALQTSVDMGLEKEVFTAGEKERLATLRKNLESTTGPTATSGNMP